MKSYHRVSLKSQHSTEITEALESLQTLDEDECRLAIESLQTMRDGPGIGRADFITILALRMRLTEFESVLM